MELGRERRGIMVLKMKHNNNNHHNIGSLYTVCFFRGVSKWRRRQGWKKDEIRKRRENRRRLGDASLWIQWKQLHTNAALWRKSISHIYTKKMYKKLWIQPKMKMCSGVQFACVCENWDGFLMDVYCISPITSLRSFALFS
jgi:hypothetical protein